MKYLILAVLLIGCSTAPKIPTRELTPYERCNIISHKAGITEYTYAMENDDHSWSCVLPLDPAPPIVHSIPKFKVGDCIRTYDSYERKISDIMQDEQLDDYGVLIGLECNLKNWFRCSKSAYPIKGVDANSVKIECPKNAQD